MQSIRTQDLIAVLFLLCCVVGCASSPPYGESRGELEAYMVALEEQVLKDLFTQMPQSREIVEEAAGYAVIHAVVSKYPGVGFGRGYGVVVESATESRFYIAVGRIDIGAGLGVRTFDVVTVFKNAEDIRRFAKGRLLASAGSDTALKSGDGGDGSIPISHFEGEKYTAYYLTRSGAAATITLRIMKVKPIDLPAE